MPLYEYRCTRCGEKFERLRRMQDADCDVVCPRCESEKVERLLSAFARSGSSACASGPGRRFT
jgi:putative FmdB family regulatory protein